MTTTENSSKEYICKICIKYYSSRQNLWRHNHTFHNSEILQNAPKSLECTPKLLPNAPKMLSNAEEMNEPSVKKTFLEEKPCFSATKSENQLQCEYCKIIFTRKYNLKRHYDTCKQKIIEHNKINKQNELLQQQLKESEIKMREEMKEEMKEEMAAMKKQLLSIMNKQCKVHPKTLQKINNTLNNNCNNTNIINIVQLGNENLETVFSKNKQIACLCT
jgi:hypothetical protein